ncbi:MAG: hypothetical protein GY898_01685 [Proteobacteria bacterium]|nr:hypothetical protein [Pseudomonadota bacterium]
MPAPAHADVIETHPSEARRALAEGRCADAATWAQGLLDVHPEMRLVGDAARCSGDRTVEAVRAYRHYESLGGADFQVLQALKAMSGMLGRVRVEVSPDQSTSPLAAWSETSPPEELSTNTRTSEPPGAMAAQVLFGDPEVESTGCRSASRRSRRWSEGCSSATRSSAPRAPPRWSRSSAPSRRPPRRRAICPSTCSSSTSA